MNNKENKLIKLVDLIRKDTGVNSVIDAIEQLSLFLLLKYFYDSFLKRGMEYESEFRCSNSFRDLFEEVNYYNSEVDFSKFKDALNQIINDDNRSLYGNCIVESDLYHAEYIFNNIPFRVRSEKILKALVYGLEDIRIESSLAEDYDELLTIMVNESSSSGAFYSPRSLVKAIVKVTNPTIGQVIYDPAFGTGRFIVESLGHLSNSSTKKLNNAYRGCDISPFAYLVGSLNLLLNGFDMSNITLGDSLVDTENEKFDIIFATPPFGKVSNNERYSEEYYGDTSSLELMFLKLSMKKLKKNGKSAIIVPDGVLFSSTNELARLRRELLTNFNLHSILSLPSGTLSPYSGVKVSVLFFDNTPAGKDIWFYELATEKSFSKKNQISDSDLIEFVNLFSLRSEGKSSCLVEQQNILNRKGCNLSIEIPRKSTQKKNFDVFDEIERLKEENEKYYISITNFSNTLKRAERVSFDRKVTIGEMFKTRVGQSLKRSEIEAQGNVPVYGANGIIGYYNESNRDGENILIGRVGAHCGNIYYTTDQIWLTDNSFSVQLHSPNEVHMPYLAHVLRSLELNSFARGSAQPSISFSKIQDIEFNLPSFEQQIELARWFDEMRSQEVRLLESLQFQSDLFSKLVGLSIGDNCINNS
ncbi:MULTISPECIES: N-6 DNA methylase [Vibrio]|uniref:N-6 DNA methylase n=1 Tax=Vibrio TaxID=662 RepID=UPI00030DF39B|nr:N-6 DNA methylase [Vibrio tasmaniensis]OEF83417.1 hypothetical protein A162_11970 [Vibrio tasmaniensis 1F-155]